MTNTAGLNRRTLLYAFGIASVSSMLPAQAISTGKAVVTRPGDSRFAFTTEQQAWLTPCKLTGEDSGGVLSAFELHVRPQSGPGLHVHHREDEWYYVLAGQFIFRAGEKEYNLPPGSSIWLPRNLPHVWANTSSEEGKLILVCQPGGFEKFFEEMGSEMARVNHSAANQRMKEVMAKYGMELLGPPILNPLRQ